jgi:RNA polymerase sigma-70 factor (ECF subfamily)
LPEPHHTILVLIDLEDHSYEEAAAVLDVPVGTVRSRLFRARRMIQEALIAYAEDAGVASRRDQPVRTA